MSYCSRSRRRRFTVLDFKSGAFTAIFSNICTAHTQERLFMNFRCIPIWIKFCMVVDITDVVTYTNFGDHRLRGLWVAGGQISPFPIDFHRRPYNTRATMRVCDEISSKRTDICVDRLCLDESQDKWDRGVHGDGDSGNPAESASFPRVWV